MKRLTRAQAKHNAIPEIPITLPDDLPAPSTSRNLIPRSRATSLARSATRSLPGSRGSSRQSSLSGARSRDSSRHLESSLSESRPPTPSGTISEMGPARDIAYSRGRNQVLSPSSADTPAEGTSNVSQSQEPSSSSTTQQRRSSPRMYPFYGFHGSNSGQGGQSGNNGNTFQGNADGMWHRNFDADDVPQQEPEFFPFNDSEDAFAMRQNLSLGVNGNSSMMQNDFASSTAGPAASSSSGYRSSSNIPQPQSFNGANLDQSGMNSFWDRPNINRPSHSYSSPSYGYNSMPDPHNHNGNLRGYFTGHVVPPSPPEEQEYYFHNHAANFGWQPPRAVHLAHHYDPFNTQASMDYLGSTNPSLAMNSGGSAGPSTQPPTPSTESASFYQHSPSELSANPDNTDPLSGGYPSNAMNFGSLSQWQPVGGPSPQGATSGSTSSKRKRSPENDLPSHPSSSHFHSSFRPVGDPSSQGSGRVDSDNEVAEQLLYFKHNSSSQSQLDPNSAGPSSQGTNSFDRKGKGKARAQTPVKDESIIDITDSPPSDRHRPSTTATVDTSVPDAEHTGSRQKPPADSLSSYTCPICFSQPTNATITPCGHICCGACLFAAVKTTMQRSSFGMGQRPPLSEARCPVCRATIPGWDGKGGGVIGLKVRAIFSL